MPSDSPQDSPRSRTPGIDDDDEDSRDDVSSHAGRDIGLPPVIPPTERDAQAAVAEELAAAARSAVARPDINAAITQAARDSVNGGILGISGLGGLGSSAVTRAVDTALTDAAKEAISSPAINRAITQAARDSVNGGILGISGLGGLGSSAVTRAVDTALTDAAKEAISSPAINRAITQAARDSVNGGILGISGLGGPGSSAVTRAVDTALTDAAKEAISSPAINRAITQAARDSVNGGILGISGLGGLGSSAVTRAVDTALTDAAKEAISSPAINAAITEAARRSTSSPWALGPDPALAFALQQDGRRMEPAAAVEQPEMDAVELDADERPVATEGVFSDDYRGPGSFFATHEVVVDSFAVLTKEIQALAAKNRDLSFVWRGQQNANWGLHSSLYRRLMKHSQVNTSPPRDGDQRVQRFPDEDAMLTAELSLVDKAVEWRMSETPALELFARLQHHGGPTRLLDVTRNPLIATWFAVEAGTEDESDARLFALGTGAAVEGTNSTDDRPVVNEMLAGGRYPFWTYQSAHERIEMEWGTGSRRRIWVPPAYDARIAAQNAAFLVEGVPMLTRRTLRLFQSGRGSRHWNAVDVAASMSIYARPTNPHKRPRPTRAMLAPLFSFRITAGAKREIRDMLDGTYGYTAALLYPDIQGMSARLSDRSDWLESPIR